MLLQVQNHRISHQVTPELLREFRHKELVVARQLHYLQVGVKMNNSLQD